MLVLLPAALLAQERNGIQYMTGKGEASCTEFTCDKIAYDAALENARKSAETSCKNYGGLRLYGEVNRKKYIQDSKTKYDLTIEYQCRSCTTTAIPQDLVAPHSLTMGNGYACVIDQGQVRCWGIQNCNLGVIPQLNRPKVVSLGAFGACAIDQDGLKCWNGASYDSSWEDPSFKSMPTNLQNVKTVSVGSQNACVLDGSKVECWGPSAQNTKAILGGVQNPDAVFTGAMRYLCVTENGKLKCANPKFSDKVNMLSWQKHTAPIIDSIQDPIAVIASPATGYCAIEKAGTVKCWNLNFYNVASTTSLIKKAKAVKSLAIGMHHLCVIDDQLGLECASDTSRRLISIPKGLLNPREVVADDDETCVIDDNGVQCWNAEFIHH